MRTFQIVKNGISKQLSSAYTDVELQFVPLDETDAVVGDCRLFLVHITNNNGTDADVYVRPKDQATKYIIPPITVNANGGTVTFSEDEFGVFMSGGITWKASIASILDGTIVYARYSN